MNIRSYYIVLIIALTACTANTSNDQIGEKSGSEPVEFPSFNSKFSNKQTLDITDDFDQDFYLDSGQE